MKTWTLLLLAALTTLPAAQAETPNTDAKPESWHRASREYVLLTLSMAKHDAAFVDAYYGPAEIKQEAESLGLDRAAIRTRSEALLSAVADLATDDAALKLRRQYLARQTQAMIARIDMLDGKSFRFDQETDLLYDAVAPSHSREHFLQLHAELEKLLPGEGALPARLERYRERFIIPRDRLRAVFDAAIEGCRKQTLAHLKLPEGEGFKLEFVTDKPWSGYNWYQGKFQSLIQINVELPIYIERAIDLGCHEGYPGHHTYNVLLEQELVGRRGWTEFSVYPLWSPQSLIAEGSANYGIDIAFPAEERRRFQREVLYPLAGIDPELVDQYEQVLAVLGKLSYAGNEAARAYVDGRMDRQQAMDWLVEVELYPQAKALQRTKFFDVNRGYVINYNLGKDLVKDWVERETRGAADPATARWQVFSQLLASPRLPSDLK